MKLLKLAKFFVDAIFPEFCLFCSREGYILCPSCAGALPLLLLHGCPFCNRVSLNGITCESCESKTPLRGVFSFGLYNDPRLRELIIALKYHGKRDLAATLANRVTPVISAVIPSLSGYARSGEDRPRDLVFTAVPLHTTRLKSRGYNQSELLARVIAERLGLPYVELLERTRATPAQVGLGTVTERLNNVRNAFSVIPSQVEGSRTVTGSSDHDVGATKSTVVLLVDDVVTTGSTLTACARTLKHAGVAAVYGLTIARG